MGSRSGADRDPTRIGVFRLSLWRYCRHLKRSDPCADSHSRRQSQQHDARLADAVTPLKAGRCDSELLRCRHIAASSLRLMRGLTTHQPIKTLLLLWGRPQKTLVHADEEISFLRPRADNSQDSSNYLLDCRVMPTCQPLKRIDRGASFIRSSIIPSGELHRRSAAKFQVQ
jgi:hypothetical protein